MNKFSYETDSNGQYFFNGQRMLVYFIRGQRVVEVNPEYKYIDSNGVPHHNLFVPQLISRFYPGPVGVVIALWDGEGIRYGYSRVNLNAGDKFNKKQCLDMAIGRAMCSEILPPFDDVHIPNIVRKDLQRMYGRAKNYYKYLFQQPPSH